jgi:hypothetical protein
MRTTSGSVPRATALAFRAPALIWPGGGEALASQWRKLMTALFDPYRPELHYMRGPGPKWREKHGQRAPFGQR